MRELGRAEAGPGVALRPGTSRHGKNWRPGNHLCHVTPLRHGKSLSPGRSLPWCRGLSRLRPGRHTAAHPAPGPVNRACPGCAAWARCHGGHQTCWPAGRCFRHRWPGPHPSAPRRPRRRCCGRYHHRGRHLAPTRPEAPPRLEAPLRPAAPARPRSAAPDRPWPAAPPRPRSAPLGRPWLRAAPGAWSPALAASRAAGTAAALALLACHARFSALPDGHHAPRLAGRPPGTVPLPGTPPGQGPAAGDLAHANPRPGQRS